MSEMANPGGWQLAQIRHRNIIDVPKRRGNLVPRGLGNVARVDVEKPRNLAKSVTVG